MDIKSRIRKGISVKYMSFKDFCSDTGVNYRTLQHYLSGERQPSTEFLTILTDQIGLSASWVLTGKGDMMVTERPQNAHKIVATSHNHLSDIEKLLTAIRVVETALHEAKRKVNPDQKAEIIVAAYELLGEMEEGTEEKIIRLVRVA